MGLRCDLALEVGARQEVAVAHRQQLVRRAEEPQHVRRPLLALDCHRPLEVYRLLCDYPMVVLVDNQVHGRLHLDIGDLNVGIVLQHIDAHKEVDDLVGGQMEVELLILIADLEPKLTIQRSLGVDLVEIE